MLGTRPGLGNLDSIRRQRRALGAGALTAGEGAHLGEFDGGGLVCRWYRAARFYRGAVTGHGPELQAKKSRLKEGRLFRGKSGKGRACVLTGSIHVPTGYKVALLVAIIND
ncbi:hypothetical protein EMIT0P74_220085 [Pseudomonas sp. IT-P74]